MASLHDAYELGGVAGHGRTTLVRLAVRRGDCQPVALKQLRMEHAVDPDKRGRFIRQYRRACMLDHQNIERLLDIVEGDDGPVAVSEWVDGRSLLRLSGWRRKNDDPWAPEEIAVIARSLLEALHYAHHHPTDFAAQGMLHGGIWPGNVLVNVEGNVKLVDFGMASVWQEAPEPWQDLDALRYLSADHVRHGPSAASDIYSVGALVHEMISGQRFRDECETEAEMRMVIDHPEPPPPCGREVPPALERLRRGLLEPVPNPRSALEHMLALCASIPAAEGQDRLSALVRKALRIDSTQPDPEPASLGGAELPLDGIARARSRASAVVHHAAGHVLELEQIPLGQAPRQIKPRDTQSVPVPIQHEVTAAREPMFLHQTAPPKGERARHAEQRRSGVAVAPPADPDVDTVPLDEPRAQLSAELRAAGDESSTANTPRRRSRRISDMIFDPDATAEVNKIAQLPEDRAREQAATTAAADVETETEPERRHWLRGPLGWALLGALLVGVGLPLFARCNSQPTPAPSARP
ncbi:MAG: protein kinase [Myxococcota bacterium]